MWNKKLSSALKLKEWEQDWGICNADPSRVVEFIEFYESNSVEHPWEPEALAELIFESMNDALEQRDLTPTLVERFRRFVREHCAEFPCQLAYWTSLAEDDAFPVAEITRQALA